MSNMENGKPPIGDELQGPYVLDAGWSMGND